MCLWMCLCCSIWFIDKWFYLQVALKTLIVIHRALREVDPTFHEELINYGRSRSHMLNMAHFKDDSSPNGACLDPHHWSCYKFNHHLYWGCIFIRVLLLSMGLFCMGPQLCIIFRGKAGMFSRVEVWHWGWSSCKIINLMFQNLNFSQAAELSECYSIVI